MICTSFERSNSYVFGARSSKLWHNFEGIKSSIEKHLLYFINGRLFGNERYAVYIEFHFSLSPGYSVDDFSKIFDCDPVIAIVSVLQ